MTPSKLRVIIEGDDTEKDAKFIEYSHMYNACLYRTGDGREFYIDPGYIQEQLEKHFPVKVPLAVITQLEEMRSKLEWGQEVLKKQAKEKETGLTLPDDYKV